MLTRCEQSSKTQTEQALDNYEELKAKVFLLEKKYSHVQRHIERNENGSAGSRLEFKGEEEKIALLEKRIGKKVAETVDQLGEIIKDYAQKQSRLLRRVSELESRSGRREGEPL